MLDVIPLKQESELPAYLAEPKGSYSYFQKVILGKEIEITGSRNPEKNSLLQKVARTLGGVQQIVKNSASDWCS